METNTPYSAQRWEAERSAYSEMMAHWLIHFRLLKTAKPSLLSMGENYKDALRLMASRISNDPEEEYYLLETFNLL